MQTDNLEVLIPTTSNQEKREEWNELEYYLINIGTNVGIGCIWRFSYLMYEGGGGAFLIPYLISNFVVSFPSLCMLITLGQENGKGIISVYQEISQYYKKNFVGFAITKIIYCLMVSTFYVYLLVYNLMFIFDIVIGYLPWLEHHPSSEKMLINLNSYFENRILNQNQISGININLRWNW